MSYYINEISKISSDAPCVNIKITGWAQCESTQWLGINNQESIDALRAFLDRREAMLNRYSLAEMAIIEANKLN